MFSGRAFAYAIKKRAQRSLLPKTAEELGKKFPFLGPMISETNIQPHKIEQSKINLYATGKLQDIEKKMDILLPMRKQMSRILNIK